MAGVGPRDRSRLETGRFSPARRHPRTRGRPQPPVPLHAGLLRARARPSRVRVDSAERRRVGAAEFRASPRGRNAGARCLQPHPSRTGQRAGGGASPRILGRAAEQRRHRVRRERRGEPGRRGVASRCPTTPCRTRSPSGCRPWGASSSSRSERTTRRHTGWRPRHGLSRVGAPGLPHRSLSGRHGRAGGARRGVRGAGSVEWCPAVRGPATATCWTGRPNGPTQRRGISPRACTARPRSCLWATTSGATTDSSRCRCATPCSTSSTSARSPRPAPSPPPSRSSTTSPCSGSRRSKSCPSPSSRVRATGATTASSRSPCRTRTVARPPSSTSSTSAIGAGSRSFSMSCTTTSVPRATCCPTSPPI